MTTGQQGPTGSVLNMHQYPGRITNTDGQQFGGIKLQQHMFRDFMWFLTNYKQTNYKLCPKC